MGERWGCRHRGHESESGHWSPSWNQIQTLKDCLCCHIYCTQLGTSWDSIVGCLLKRIKQWSRSGLTSPKIWSHFHQVVHNWHGRGFSTSLTGWDREQVRGKMFFPPDTDAYTSRRSPDTHPPPPLHLEKTWFWDFDVKNQNIRPKFKYLVPKSQNVALNSNISDKIQLE